MRSSAIQKRDCQSRSGSVSPLEWNLQPSQSFSSSLMSRHSMLSASSANSLMLARLFCALSTSLTLRSLKLSIACTSFKKAESAFTSETLARMQMSFWITSDGTGPTVLPMLTLQNGCSIRLELDSHHA
ncbi:hypothetical protein EMPG_16298 [Blastomyces silverae]|uniref:Uncharacterized protein n=1 Tax=Blastomyces silverae TaxID=2060906 RepID=A0A0H1BA14_9EURO|nr:hypothetical protein EMPG_16298 [Blastomyces silverae]